MKFLSKITKLIRLILKGEFSRFLHQVSLQLPEWIDYNLYYFMTAKQLNFPNKLNNNISVKVATIDDIDEVVRVSSRPIENVRSLLEQGVKVFLGGENNQPYSSVLWSASGHCYVNGAGWDYDFGDKMPYLFWVFTLPESRGKGIYAKLLSEYYDYYKNNGAERFCCLVEKYNEQSYLVQSQFGYKTHDTIKIMKIFSLKILLIIDNQKKRRVKFVIKEPANAKII